MYRLRKSFAPALLRCLLVLPLVSAVLVQSVSADTVRLLDDDNLALAARFGLIDSAQRRIDWACFELRKDVVSYAVLARLQEAARRGVDVRLVIDAYGNRIPQSVLAELVENGVQIRRYHPLRFEDVHNYTQRLHDKLLIADEHVMILGGRNLGAVYFGRAAEKNFRDRDVEVTGATVHRASAYFEQLWTSRHVVPAKCCSDDRPVSPKWEQSTPDSPLGVPLRSPRQLLQRGLAHSYSDALASHPGGSIRPTLNIPPERIHFLHSSEIFTGHSPDISDQLLGLIASARREILIETPYLILSARFQDALRAAVGRGVCVRVLCNSLASIDKPLVHAGYVNQKKSMLRMGIDLWEYQGPDMLHAKTMLIDGCAVIGSYNLHPRSEYYDTEIAIVVIDVKFAAELRALIDRDFEGAVRVDRSPGYRVSRKRHGFPPARRIVWMQLLRWPALLLEKHL
jgi:putative cardiolipin synthase